MRNSTKNLIVRSMVFVITVCLALVVVLQINNDNVLAQTPSQWTGADVKDPYLRTVNAGIDKEFSLTDGFSVIIETDFSAKTKTDCWAGVLFLNAPGHGSPASATKDWTGIGLIIRQNDTAPGMVNMVMYKTGGSSGAAAINLLSTAAAPSDSKFEISFVKEDGKYFLYINGKKMLDGTTNVLESTKIATPIGFLSNEKVYLGFGGYNGVTTKIYSVKEGNTVYDVYDLNNFKSVGGAFALSNLPSLDFKGYGYGINEALDVSKEISVTARNTTSYWINVAFTTQASNASNEGGGALGTGFSFMFQSFGGLKIDFMHMNNGYKTVVSSYYANTIMADNPNYDESYENKDGLNLAVTSTVKIKLAPFIGEDEKSTYAIYINDVQLHDNMGNNFYDVIMQEAANKGLDLTWFNDNGFTYLNLSANHNPATPSIGCLYSLKANDRSYTVEDIFGIGFALGLPDKITSSKAYYGYENGNYNKPLSALDAEVYFSIDRFDKGKKLVGFFKDTYSGGALDAHASGVAAGISYTQDGAQIIAYKVSNGVKTEIESELTVGVSAGNTFKLSLGIEDDQVILYINNIYLAEVTDYLNVFTDTDGKTYFNFGAQFEEDESNTDAAIVFYSAGSRKNFKSYSLFVTFEDKLNKNAILEFLVSDGGTMLYTTLTSDNKDYYFIDESTVSVSKVRVSAAGHITQTIHIDELADTVHLSAVEYDGQISVNANGKPLSGAVVKLVSGDTHVIATEIDNSGIYEYAGIKLSHQVTIEKEGYLFDSKSVQYSDNEITVHANTFTATVTLKIGQVYIPGANIIVKIDNEPIEPSITDNFDGTYTIEGLAGNYSVTAEKDSLYFETALINNNINTVVISGTYSVYITINANGSL